MTKREFLATLRRKLCSLAAVVTAAFVVAAAMYALCAAAIRLLPARAVAEWRAPLAEVFRDPASVREWLQSRGRAAPWLFVAAQVAQVILAPVPGQAVAVAGGFVFGFLKGWALTTLGLLLGSLLAMGASRLLGKRFVRNFVPAPVMSRFDSLIEDGGYTTFFMIFLLPALPDDAVCFIAGLTKLRLLPLTLVCLAGRAPGMAVLSLVGSQLTSGLSTGVKLLFAALMAVSIPLWLFWETIEEKLTALALRKKR